MLEPGKYYHIYNRANGDENLFRSEENYDFFLRRYLHFMKGWVSTFSYCLMPNHFHLFIRVNTRDEVNYALRKPSHDINSKKQNYTTDEDLSRAMSKQFAKLFSSYTQALNKQIDRTGSLFQKNFKRKEVSNLSYFQNLIVYIHNNPVSHGFVNHIEDWGHSSYHALRNTMGELLDHNEVISWFDSKENFEYCHQEALDLRNINGLIHE